ncbi:MAG: N-glycosylase/DNA lyase [Desulfurococcaceae archaeon]|nr:N-glycosylase/DNA lyase [Desulfurococcaceae archaeon]
MGVNVVLELEEVDPQYEAVADLCRVLGLEGTVASYLVAVATYHLRCTGEVFWARFSNYVRRLPPSRVVEGVVEFILGDPCNSIQRLVKVGRVLKLSKYLGEVRKLLSDCGFLELWRLTYRALEADPASKTVVFAVKMGYYGTRALGICRGPLPMEIPIPLDRRVARATLNLGIIRAGSLEDVMRCRDVVVESWRSIGESSGIPPIHLDLLLWALQNSSTLSKALRRVDQRRGEVLRTLLELVEQSRNIGEISEEVH